MPPDKTRLKQFIRLAAIWLTGPLLAAAFLTLLYFGGNWWHCWEICAGIAFAILICCMGTSMIEPLWFAGVLCNLYVSFKANSWLQESWQLRPNVAIPMSAVLGFLPYLAVGFILALALRMFLGGPFLPPRKPS